ncbi:hypothetical protein CEXT_358141 [Caerostris extrusa]|uniref:Uncharacterized protein n=1 Tax=Caerostris extrusa TaxID=172846 RepID=A0AAV4XQF8_CAEEX|nr:hypothetical protein CEXT_358141 [Caerostris extrusa]
MFSFFGTENSSYHSCCRNSPAVGSEIFKEELQAGKIKLQSQQARVQHLEDELGVVRSAPEETVFFPRAISIGSQYILGYSLSSAHSTIIFKTSLRPTFINAPLLNSAGEEYQRRRGSVTGSPLSQRVE